MSWLGEVFGWQLLRKSWNVLNRHRLKQGWRQKREVISQENASVENGLFLNFKIWFKWDWVIHDFYW